MSDEVVYSEVHFTPHHGYQGQAVGAKGGEEDHEGSDPAPGEPSAAGAAGSKVTTPGAGGGGGDVRLPLFSLIALCVLLLGLAIALGFLYGKTRADQQSSEHRHKVLYDEVQHNLSAELRFQEERYHKLQNESNNVTAQRADLYTRLQKCNTDLSQSRRRCAPDWVLNPPSCYFFSTDKLTWKESRYACVKAGGHLVIVGSQEEQEFLRSRVGNVGFENSYWIGLTDEGHEAEWIWMDNTALTDSIKYWDTKEPNNKDGREPENCARIGQNCENKRECWFDNRCNRRSKRICESQGG